MLRTDGCCPYTGRKANSPALALGGGGGGGGGFGAVVGALLGLGITLLIAKTLQAKPQKPRRLAFVPFEYIAVHTADLPQDIEIKEKERVGDLSISLIKWEKEPQELEEKLSGKVLAFGPNRLYQQLGFAQAGATAPTTKEEKPSLALLDAGADQQLVGHALIFTKNMLRSPYEPEAHGTGVVYVALSASKRGVVLYRVCSKGVCEGWAILKALADAYRQGIKVINMSFGTQEKDRVVEYVIKYMNLRGFVFFAPVGNQEAQELPFPASLDEVVSVAGEPCFPKGLCQKAKATAPYRFKTPFGELVGTSFSSAYRAGLSLGIEPMRVIKAKTKMFGLLHGEE